jgi:hypothetical protein
LSSVEDINGYAEWPLDPEILGFEEHAGGRRDCEEDGAPCEIARTLHREVKTVHIVAQMTNKVYGIMDLIFQKSVCFCLLVMEKGNTKSLTPIFNKKL